MVQVWKNKRRVQMKNAIHEAKLLKSYEKMKRKQKPCHAVQYNKFIKDAEYTDQYLNYEAVSKIMFYFFTTINIIFVV
jgi:hypothetical protein